MDPARSEEEESWEAVCEACTSISLHIHVFWPLLPGPHLDYGSLLSTIKSLSGLFNL